MNDPGNKMSHSIDFHAARVDVLNEFAPIKPCETKNGASRPTIPVFSSTIAAPIR